MDFSKFKFNFRLLLQEIASRGIKLRTIGETPLVEASINGHVEHLLNYTTSLTPIVYSAVWQDKYQVKQLMKDHGYSVCEGNIFAPEEINRALEYALHLGFPVVIKPRNGSNGNFVFPNLINKQDFTESFDEIAAVVPPEGPIIMIEKHFENADDYRFLIVPNKDIAVVRRTPPKVIGDGISSIKHLIAAENYKRMNPRRNCLCEIYVIDRDGKRALRDQGINFNTVPQKGQEVQLRYQANVSWGGECENVLNLVHHSYLEMVRKIALLFPKAGFVSIDLLVKDISKPVSDSNYVISEFGWDPGFSLHLMPSKGAPHNILKPIVDVLFPETSKT